MCGIAGVIGANLSPRDLEALVRASDVIRHRGPDGEGFVWLPAGGSRLPVPMAGPATPAALSLPRWESLKNQVEGAGALFAHRRLSILDVSEAGHQPMNAAAGKLWITFNGEVYNYRELREELRGNFDFRSGTDTEVLLAAWLAWGPAMLPRLTGMFSFAVADFRVADQPEFFLARDPFGIKPCYYAWHQGAFIFASEIKALLAAGVSPKANPTRLHRYLTDGLTDYGSGSMFSGIYQLPAAHWLKISLKSQASAPLPVCYWNGPARRPVPADRDEAAALVRNVFLRNVALHLRSDVPLGAALSGGIDSSSIVGAIREVEPGAVIKAIGYVAESESMSEERWMDMAAESAGATLYKCSPGSGALMNGMERLIRTQDEPFGSTSIFAQWTVFKAAADQGLKVMLDGQGADEMLAGYPLYPARRLETLIRMGRFSEAFQFWRAAGPRLGMVRLLAQTGATITGQPLSELVKRTLGRSEGSQVLNENWFKRHGVLDDRPSRITDPERLRAELWHTLRVSSLPMLLRYEDRNSMAHSVESRVPFLTVELTETLLSLPEKWLVDDQGTSKAIFRQAMRGIVPDPVLNRLDKIGFVTPERQWLQELRPWVENQLDSLKNGVGVGLDPDKVLKQWRALTEGRARFDFRFWRWLNVIAWSRCHGLSQA